MDDDDLLAKHQRLMGIEEPFDGLTAYVSTGRDKIEKKLIKRRENYAEYGQY